MPCTTVLVGRKASNDGSTMIARTDDGHFDVKKLIVVEPKDQPRKYKTVNSHAVVELPDNPMRYTTCPNVDKKDGLWLQSGVWRTQATLHAQGCPRCLGPCTHQARWRCA